MLASHQGVPSSLAAPLAGDSKDGAVIETVSLGRHACFWHQKRGRGEPGPAEESLGADVHGSALLHGLTSVQNLW